MPGDSLEADILNDIDWAALLRCLRYYARRIARDMPSIFDGISPDDLVGETLTAFLADPEGLG